MAVIEHRGDLQWRARVRARGFATYSRTFERRTDARAWARDVEAAIGRRDLVEVRRLTGTGDELGGTVADLVDRYVREVLPSRRQVRSERPRLVRIRQALGRLTLAMLSPADVARWRDQRLREGGSLANVRHDLNTLSKLLGHAISEWAAPIRNVVRDVRKPPLARGRERRVSAPELELLLRAARHAPRPGGVPARGLAALITLAIETSMRLGELVGMHWRDIDMQHRTVHLMQTKNGHQRTVALSTAAMAALAELQQVRRLDGRVFTWRSPGCVTIPFRRCVRRAHALYLADCQAAGTQPAAGFLQDIRFHDLRHEATSRLFELGLNPMEVASMTGHRSMQMLRRYTHVEARHLAAKLG